MAVNITSVTFYDEYNGPYGTNTTGVDSAGVPYLEGCVGDRVWVKILGNVEWSSQPSGASFSGNTITRQDCGTPSATNTASFIIDGFKSNDVIVVTGTSSNNGTFNVVSVTDSTLTIVQTLTAESAASPLIQGATPVNQLNLGYNMIPSSQANTTATTIFNSLSDTNFKQIVTFYPGSPGMAVYQQRSLAWVDTDAVDSFTPEIFFPFGNTGTSKNFEIIMLMYVKPYSLSNQLSILQQALQGSENAPSYFLNNQDLSFVCAIEAVFDEGSTAVAHTSSTSTSSILYLPGKTYWFNEPTVPPNGSAQSLPWYAAESITYTDVNTGLPVTSVDLSSVIDVTITIEANAALSLLTGDPFVLNFARVPLNIQDYQNRRVDPFNPQETFDYRKANLHDRCFTHINALSKNGDMFGTNYQVIQNVTSTIGSPDTDLIISFQINPSADIVNSMTQNLNGDAYYMIWVTPQPQSVTSLRNAARTAVLCDVQPFQKNTNEPSALTVITGSTPNVFFYQYPAWGINQKTNAVGFAGDYAYAQCDFEVANGYYLRNVTVNINNVVTGNGATNTYNLQSYNFNTSLFATANYPGEIRLNASPGFPLPATDDAGNPFPYNTISLNRIPSLDNPGFHAYELIYGWQYGFQYWQNVQNFSPIFNQWHSNYWPIYTQGQYLENPNVVPAGFTTALQFQIVWNVVNIQTGNVTTFQQNCSMSCYDTAANQTGTSPETLTLTQQTQDQFGNDANGILMADQPTIVTVLCSGTDVSVPPAGYTDLVGTMSFNYNDGTRSVYDGTDSIFGNLADSFWITPCTITVIDANNVVLEATLDLSQSVNPPAGAVYGTLTYQ